MQVGRPAQHRAAELAYADNVTVQELLDRELYEARRPSRGDSFYARSWVLYHYLTFTEARQGQLAAYWQAITGGQDSLAAATSIFGDLDDLDRELKRYVRGRLYNIVLTPEKISIGPVTLRELPEGEAQMMPVRMRSQRGVDREIAAEVLRDARDIALRHPDDPGVQTALAEAEYDAGNDAQAIAAADRALAADPMRRNAYVQKGYAMFRLAELADEPATAFDRAMEPFSALNAIEPDHPIPLIYYYRSLLERREPMREDGRHALERASQLAPFDQSLTMQTALMLAEEGKIEFARSYLQPLAADPHGGSLSNVASTLLAGLADAAEGSPWLPQSVDERTASDTERGEPTSDD